MRARAVALVPMFSALALGAGACKPDLGSPISLVDKPRILAVRGTPPEAKEGETVTYDLLAVDASGTVADPQATWAVCKLPRPPSETNSVSAACLDIADQGGPAPTFMAPITAGDPNDQTTTGACSIFGPLRPPLDPTARPRDPDITGGFYQPVRAALPGPAGDPLLAFDLQRIQCRLANAPIDVAAQFNNPYDATTNPNGYTANHNPTLGPVTLAADGGAGPVTLAPVVAGMPAPAPGSVAAGQKVTLAVSWAPEIAETFPVYDIRTVTLVPQREAVRASWFATGGVFDHDVSGRDAEDQGLSTDNGWQAPATPGTVHLWVVLRDSRGGVDFGEFLLEVTP